MCKIMEFAMHVTVFVVVAPVALCILLLSFLYMNVCKIILWITYKHKFVDLMSGADTIWQMDEYNAKSIVNIVLEVQTGGCDQNGFDAALLDDIRQAFVLKLNDANMQKLTYERCSKLGYCFWMRRDEVLIEDYIRRAPVCSRLSRSTLADFVSGVGNSYLPFSNRATWEILVCEQSLSDVEVPTVAVIVRLHHSLGDGFAFMQLLLTTLLKERCSDSKVIKKPAQQRSLFDWINIIVQIPSTALKQVVRKKDKNPLHGPELTGRKNIVWQFDDDDLLTKVLKIKKALENTTFTDIILSALSVSIHKYFLKSGDKKTKVPFVIHSCLVARSNCNGIRYDEGNVELENNMTLAIQKLPLLREELNTTQKIQTLHKYSNKKQFQFDSQINIWVIQVMASLIPEWILKMLFPTRQTTIGVSNLPGFSAANFCGGRTLNNIVFTVPTRGNTGAGLSILTYNNKLELGFIADKALINNSEDVREILIQMKNEINRMYLSL